MDWPRFGSATVDAVFVAFLLGAVVSPPDPFTQLLYAAPTFLVALPVLYRYGRYSGRPWWQRHFLHLAGVLVLVLAWQLLAFALGGSFVSPVRPAFLLAGILLGAWVAYFGGLERFRGDRAVSET